MAQLDNDKVVEEWARNLNDSLAAADLERVAGLFAENGFLRDLAALTWHFRTYRGPVEILAALPAILKVTTPKNFRLAGLNISKRKTKIDGRLVVESILDFDTNDASGKAVVRLIESVGGGYQALLLSTAIDGLRGFPERIGPHRAVGTPSLDTFGGRNWLDRRRDEIAYNDRDPEVLVVGAGQSGLGIAARLRALDVDTLVSERLPRVGDVWRNRYHSLTLHNAIWLNHLPYLPFPDTWPVYIPKDKLADWFESYAEAMELNVWTATEITGASYQPAEQCWNVTLDVGGDTRTLHPTHIVMATGASGTPSWPAVPGMERFQGQMMHSAQFEGGPGMYGGRAVVFGSGNSAHDVAQDLYLNRRYNVTMVQRSSTTIVDIKTVHEVYDRYSTRLSPEHADLMLMATPYEMALDAFRSMTKIARERDRELIARLHAVGFRTDYGEDDTGHRMKYLRHGGGYYINVGCSNLIADGRVGLISSEQVESIVENGVKQTDGHVLEADLIVMATGYEDLHSMVRRVFGSAVAERVGPIWGYDADGELQAMYKRTGQPGLWFHAGSLTQSRIYSKVLALQIKACLTGLIPADAP